ncbi:MAG TPA: hypothetical protein VKB80_30285 [Kofleriaceae bacterium]|nr:hypothetical protein [Kofleriaceae bacterium]
MMPSDPRNALLAVVLAVATPACTVDNGGEDFLLRPAYGGGDGGTDGGDDGAPGGGGVADGPIHFALIHMELEDGLQAQYRPYDIFVDDVAGAAAEPTSSIDAYTGVTPGTHDISIFEKFHTGDSDPEPFGYADEPTVTFDSVDFETGPGYVLTSIGERDDFALDVVSYSAPAEGGTLVLWNLSSDPMKLLAWPEAGPCQPVGMDSFDGDPGTPVVVAEVAPGEKTSVPVTEPELSLTINDEHAYVEPATEGSVSMAVQFPRLGPAAQQWLDDIGSAWPLFSSFQLLGPPLYEVDLDCE